MAYKVAAMVFYLYVFGCLATVSVATCLLFFMLIRSIHMKVHMNKTGSHLRVISFVL